MHKSRDTNDGFPVDTCPYCGVIYRKANPHPALIDIDMGVYQPSISERLEEIFLPPNKPFDSMLFTGRLLTRFLLLYGSFV